MTYVKTNWKTGDTITADKLNNIENGIASSGGGGGGVLILHPVISESEIDLKISYTDLKTNFLSGKTIILSAERTHSNDITTEWISTLFINEIEEGTDFASLSVVFMMDLMNKDSYVEISDFDADIVISL